MNTNAFKLGVLLFGLLSIGFFVSIHSAQAAAGDIVVSVFDEAGLDKISASEILQVTVSCPGGANFTAIDDGANDDDGLRNASVTFLAANIGNGTTAECDNGETLTLSAYNPGFVTQTATQTYDAGAQNNKTFTLQFTYKIFVKNELGADVLNAEWGNTDFIVSPVSGAECGGTLNVVYCPILLTDDDGTDASHTYFSFSLISYTYPDYSNPGIPPNPRLVEYGANRTADTDPQHVVTMTAENGLAFSHKVVIKDELGNALTPDSVTAGASHVACSISSNTAYCPVSSSDDDNPNNGFIIVKDGYVTASVNLGGDRDEALSPQYSVTMNSANGLDFAYKLTTISSEVFNTNLTATASAVSVGDATGFNTCTLSGGAWYCPVTLANSNNTILTHIVPPDGYIESSIYFLVVGTNRVTNAAAQVSDTVANIQYAIKVTPLISGTNTAVSGATVSTGDNAAVACMENGSTGIYYCAVPLSDTITTVHVTKTGYNAGINNFHDRSVATDPQEFLAVTMFVISGGGGSLPSISNNTTVTIPPVTSSPSVVNLNIVDRLNQEKDIILAQSNPENYFITVGTDSTLGLGSGERAAAVSSFKEAYGRAPVTAADWVDVLNIANGRWPITVNKTVEARAYLNFRAVYGRDADMTNSTDVNALKMMGYGVRSMKTRDLTIERFAIYRFKNIFGFNPTTARHWNIMRAIAYSGVVK